MTIGSELRQAREERGLSLREISSRTRIRIPVLRAIEQDDYTLVPSGIVLRGFLKLYAHEVGLEADGIVRRCPALQATGPDDHVGGARTETPTTAPLVRLQPRPQPELRPERQPQLPPPLAPEPPPLPQRELPSQTPAARVPESLPELLGAAATTQRVPTPVIVAVGAAGLLIAGYLMGSPAARSSSETPATSSPLAPLVDAPEDEPRRTPAAAREGAASAPAVGTVGTPASPAVATDRPGDGAAVPGPLRLEVRATGACWVAVTGDGTQVASRVLNAGERVTFSVKTEAVLRIGMPANIALSINDAPVKPFARPGTPTTLRITPANYRDLLQP